MQMKMHLVLAAIVCEGTFDPKVFMGNLYDRMSSENFSKWFDFLEWVHENDLTFRRDNVEKVYELYKKDS